MKRIRNLLRSDHNAATKVVSGYTKTQEVHKEGDIWQEDTKTWTIENGIRTRVSKLEELRKYVKTPFVCPKCSNTMKGRLSLQMWKIHRLCFDCVLEYEALLKLTGRYEAYEKTLLTEGRDKAVEDLESWIKEEVETIYDNVTEDGQIEDWKTNTEKQKEVLLKEVKEFTDSLRNVK